MKQTIDSMENTHENSLVFHHIAECEISPRFWPILSTSFFFFTKHSDIVINTGVSYFKTTLSCLHVI